MNIFVVKYSSFQLWNTIIGKAYIQLLGHLNNAELVIMNRLSVFFVQFEHLYFS